jgi:hypothetical protein
MTERAFREVYRTLIGENPIAVRALLRILDVAFTDRIPTLAVTLGDHPILLVDLAFVTEHSANELELAAVIVHELLHVILRHPPRFIPVTDAEDIAFDAVIDAIIHLTMGPEASAPYAPNHDAALEVQFDVRGHGERLAAAWFAHPALRKRVTGTLWTPALARGRHFTEPRLPWNQRLRSGTTAGAA